MDFVLLYFVIASFLIVIVPGPTVSLIIANSLKSGVKAGLLNVFGTQVGVLVSVGDLINQGDIIGTVGSTGRSTGPHLDFRVNWFQTRLDPMSVLRN